MRVLAVFNGISETNIPYENFRQVSGEGLDKGVCTFDGVVTDEELHRIPGSTAVQISSDNKKPTFGCLIVLSKAIIGFRPDVIHVHHALSGFIASIIGRWITRSKIVVTIHNNYHHFGKMNKVLLWMNMHLANVIVCNSESTKQSIKKVMSERPYNKKVCVIYNGVDSTKIIKKPAIPEGGRKDMHVRFLIVGRLVKAKGHDLLLKAISELKIRGREVSLDVIGGGVLREEFEQLARKYNIESQVRFLGPMKREEVYAELAETDCMVVPSRWEGFCNAMVEAMFSGVPIVASDLDVLKEVLGERNGIFFASGSEKNLEDKLAFVMDDYESALEIAKRAQIRAERCYEIKESAANYERIYNAVVTAGCSGT